MRRLKENFFYSFWSVLFSFLFLSELVYEIFMADATGRPLLHHKEISAFYWLNAW